MIRSIDRSPALKLGSSEIELNIHLTWTLYPTNWNGSFEDLDSADPKPSAAPLTSSTAKKRVRKGEARERGVAHDGAHCGAAAARPRIHSSR
jgi:hypothetical protein